MTRRFSRRLRSAPAAALLLTAACGAARAEMPEPYASADPKRGRILFLQCVACHDLAPSGFAKVGPKLAGLPGKAAGVDPDFSYSEALLASGIVWTPEVLDRFLEQPAVVVPGTLMAFAGIARPADRAALVRYVFSTASAD